MVEMGMNTIGAEELGWESHIGGLGMEEELGQFT